MCAPVSLRFLLTLGLRKEKKEKKNYAGVITLQAWIKETETELSDGKVLMLPGRFKRASPKSLA